MRFSTAAMSNAPHIGPDLRSALVAMVKKRVPESEVEDVVQSTLADAYASPHAPTDPESFRRWVFGVAKNKVIDYHRRAIRETFDMPEDISGTAAPHQEVDMLRWAERNLPPGDDNKATLDWMLREGDGEKLESIAESEHVPAPRVRQRVSRLRRHLKAHWQKEVALLAAVGVAIGALVFWLRWQKDQPIANEDAARAEEMRKQAFEKCSAALYKDCIEKLDDAKRLDPAGDTQPSVQKARDGAKKALENAPPPVDSTTQNNITPAPPLTAAPEDSAKLTKLSDDMQQKMLKNLDSKSNSSDVPPVDLTAAPPSPKPSPKMMKMAPDSSPTPAPMSSSFTGGPKKGGGKASAKPKAPSGGSDLGGSSFLVAPEKPGSASK